MKKQVVGAVLATAVAALFLAGNAMAEETAPAKDAKTVKCTGVNECKGKSACSSDKNSCGGKNGCKGQGWINTTEADCTTKGGTVKS